MTHPTPPITISLLDRMADKQHVHAGGDLADLMQEAAREIERLHMALTAIIEYDTRAMYERCPDCWSDECQNRGRCRDVPLSHAGKIAQAALTPNVKVTGAARPYRAASRERSERGRP